jgi:predicted dehydrogenase
MALDRRRFVSIAAGLAATGVWSVGQSPRPVLRAAIIGHTGRGDYGHGLDGIFRDRDGVELVGVADPDPAGRAKVARAVGASRTYADWREMLEREKPQVVSIAMRHADQHAEVALACLRAGAHLYMEKPFVRSPDEADAVLKEAETRGLRVAVAHTMRMTPVMQKLRRAVSEGLIGELREMRAFGKQDARAGGEDLMVLGTHLFDLMRLFAGDPLWAGGRVLQQGRPVTASDRRRVKDDVGWVAGDQVFAQFGFRGGVHATFTSDASLRETTAHWGIEFHGSKGVVRMNADIAPQVFVRSTTGWSKTGRVDQWKPFDEEAVKSPPEHNRAPVQDWLEAIREGREPECSGRNGAWAVEMVSGVYASALHGGWAEFPLAGRGHPLGHGKERAPGS